MATSDFRTLNELFLTAVENHSKPDAFRFKSCGRYQSLSSREALRKVAALAVALDRLGVARGDRVAILSENRVEWALTDYAVLGLGASVVPVFPTLLEPDVEYLLRDSASKGAVVSSEVQAAKVLNIRSRLPALGFVLVMGRGALTGDGVQSWEEVVGRALDSSANPVDFYRAKALDVAPGETASILYTSGTTGEPKGVVLTHANLVSNIRATRGLFPLGKNDVAMSFLPLSHVFERMLDYYYFSFGVSIAYAESLDALPHNLLEVRPNVMAVVPRVLEKVHAKVLDVAGQSPAWKQKLFHWAVDVGRQCIPHRLARRSPPPGLRLKLALADWLIASKVRARLGGRVEVLISGAAPLSPDLGEFFYAVGLPVYEGYGLTETSPVISVNYPGCVKPGTAGRVVPGVEIKIDAAGSGERGGEILVRGPSVTRGYYHREEDNRKAFVDGWFRTGDLGVLDADGFLTLIGRKKNLLKTSGGKYISPEKLENLFQGHPYVSQVVVLGEGRRFVGALIVPNFERLEALGRERGIAFASREELLARPEIQGFIEQQLDEATKWLAPYEKIRQFALLPREFTIASGELSPTQKIKRRVVEEHYRDLIEEIYQRHAPQIASV